ncbi:MAG: hypothetical protein ACLUIQ_03560 [Dialister invisus]
MAPIRQNSGRLWRKRLKIRRRYGHQCKSVIYGGIDLTDAVKANMK